MLDQFKITSSEEAEIVKTSILQRPKGIKILNLQRMFFDAKLAIQALNWGEATTQEHGQEENSLETVNLVGNTITFESLHQITRTFDS